MSDQMIGTGIKAKTIDVNSESNTTYSIEK
jgi:hypothetical protein